MDGFLAELCAGGSGGSDATDPVDVLVERLLTGGITSLAPERTSCPVRHTAVLTALAARYLLEPGVITASVFGPPVAARRHTSMLACRVPGVSHISIHLTDRPAAGEPALTARVVDQLDLAGIGWSLTDKLTDNGVGAAVGANLVVVAGSLPEQTGADTAIRLADGALVVNTSGRDLPDTLTQQVDEVFVDDLALVAPTAEEGHARPTYPATTLRAGCRLAADLRQVVRGEHIGRPCHNRRLLVELLSAPALS